MWETWVQSLGQEDPLEKEMATHSSTLSWKIPWMEETGRLQSMGLQSWTRLNNFTGSLDTQTHYLDWNPQVLFSTCRHSVWFTFPSGPILFPISAYGNFSSSFNIQFICLSFLQAFLKQPKKCFLLHFYKSPLCLITAVEWAYHTVSWVTFVLSYLLLLDAQLAVWTWMRMGAPWSGKW